MAWGQSIQGNIADGETFVPLAGVAVVNTTTGVRAESDKRGNYTIPAAIGNKLSFSLNGYHTQQKIIISSEMLPVELLPLSVKLPQYTISNQTAFQKDSAENATLFKKEVDKRGVTPKVGFDNGLIVNGLLSATAEKFSKKFKQNKRFRNNYQKDLEQKYIDTRYRPELVTQLTGLKGEPLIAFINSHPMDYAFARAATDLEIKAWIRNTYKEYLETIAAH
jgi:hypothetical protein